MQSLFIVCWLAVGAHPAADEYPFPAEVILDQAEVQAGSGRRFYTTDRLAVGTIVEVYRRDVGGWLAIRPPAGSFSWVPASQVKQTDQPHIVEVISEDAVSWIGSRTDTVRTHIYDVKLKVGERLEVLGEKKVTDEDGRPAIWYKIAPPAGEFRWMHSREIARIEKKPEESVQRDVSAELQQHLNDAAVARETSSVVGSSVANNTEVEPAQPMGTFRARSKVKLTSLQEPYPEAKEFSSRVTPSFHEPIKTVEPTAPEQTIRPVGYEDVLKSEPTTQTVNLSEINAEKRTVSSDGFVPRGTIATKPATPGDREPLPFVPSTFRKPADGAIANANVVGAGLAANPSPITPITPEAAPISRTDMESRLSELEAELSLMVAGDPKTWQLARVRADAEKLIEQTPSAADRGRIRLLVEKIHTFATTFNVEDDPKFANLPPEAAKDEPQKPQALDPKYDGVGWLKPVVSRERPAAPYALVDSDGRPLSFITPAPGMNLNRYLNRPLGVYGRRGYIEALNTPHIVVERVIDLGRHVR